MSDARELDPALSQWLTMAVVACVAAVVGLMRFAIGLLEGFIPENIFDFWASYSFMAMVPLALCVLFSRSWFVARASLLRSGLFWTCLLLPASGFAAFVLLLYMA